MIALLLNKNSLPIALGGSTSRCCCSLPTRGFETGELLRDTELDESGVHSVPRSPACLPPPNNTRVAVARALAPLPATESHYDAIGARLKPFLIKTTCQACVCTKLANSVEKRDFLKGDVSRGRFSKEISRFVLLNTRPQPVKTRRKQVFAIQRTSTGPAFPQLGGDAPDKARWTRNSLTSE